MSVNDNDGNSPTTVGTSTRRSSSLLLRATSIAIGPTRQLSTPEDSNDCLSLSHTHV